MMKQFTEFCTSNTFNFDNETTIKNIVKAIRRYPSISSGYTFSMQIIPDIFAFLRMFRTFNESSSTGSTGKQQLCIYIAHTEHCKNVECILHDFFIDHDLFKPLLKNVTYQSKNLYIGYYADANQMPHDERPNLKSIYNAHITDDFLEYSVNTKISVANIAKLMYIQINKINPPLSPLCVVNIYKPIITDFEFKTLRFARFVTTTQNKAQHMQKLLNEKENWFLSVEQLDEKVNAKVAAEQSEASAEQAEANATTASTNNNKTSNSVTLLPLLVTIIALTMAAKSKRQRVITKKSIQRLEK